MNDKTENTLSLIDCGIKSLKDVPLKLNLISINLHSNKLTKIENLTYLHNLNHLDLSSNQIKHISGINSLVSLKSINLSCNLITTIENLDGLQELRWLNLSYNKINNLNGLSGLWGTEYSIETIILNGNFIESLDEATYYLSGLKKLKHLNLSNNKFGNRADYRAILFSTIKSLVSLDGKDKLSKTIKITPPVILSEFNDEFDSVPTKPYEELINKSSTYKKNLQVPKATIKKIKFEQKSDSSEESNLDLIENKIHRLLSIRDKIKSNSEYEDDDDDEEISVAVSKILPKKEKPKSILKPAVVNLNSELSKSDTNLDNKEDIKQIKQNNELIDLMKTQLESYRQTQDLNLKLISELRLNLDNLKEDKTKCLSEKDEKIKQLSDQNGLLSLELDNLKKTLELTKNQLEVQTNQNIQLEKDKLKENYEIAKKQFKKIYQNEIEKLNQTHDMELKQSKDKIESLEKSLRSLEDEFRAALIIESNRYNELYVRYEQANKESLTFKSELQIIELNDERNKSLIKELNELIKEQKNRLQALAKIRKETTSDIHKRDEKLTEAVADCTKLKTQLDTVRKEKLNLETKFKNFILDYNEIKKEKQTWDKKLNDQKVFLMQENNRITIENQNLISELDLAKKSLEKELDSVKIKTKILEDQTETIKKLKNALIERDELVKQNRDESLSAQKSLEKQLNEEMNLCNELQIKLNKSNQRKEELKLELEELKQNHEETRLHYEELTEKWKQKTELITDLDARVKKMKENYESKEIGLIDEKKKLEDENMKLNERLRKLDDEFRLQYDIEKREHFKSIEKLKHEYEVKLQQSDSRLKEIEEEMRLILTESANKKKFYEEKIKSFSSMFNQIQSELQNN